MLSPPLFPVFCLRAPIYELLRSNRRRWKIPCTTKIARSVVIETIELSLIGRHFGGQRGCERADGFKIGAHARASRWTRNGVTRARRNSPTIKASREASIFKGKLSFVHASESRRRDKGWKNNTFLRSNEISRRVVSILKWDFFFVCSFVCFFKRRDFDSYSLLLFSDRLIFTRPSKTVFLRFHQGI